MTYITIQEAPLINEFVEFEVYGASNNTELLTFTTWASVAEEYLSWLATILYLMYFFGRMLYTLPWAHCPLIQMCRNGRAMTNEVNWIMFFYRVKSDCYPFAQPIARIIFMLMFCNFLPSIPIVRFHRFVTKKNPPLPMCMYDAVVSQFFVIAANQWCLIIAIWMFWILVLNKDKHLLILEILSHVYVWVLSFIMTCVPWAMGAIQPVQAGTYCGIPEDERTMLLVTFYLPLWVSVFLTFVLCLITLLHVARKQYLSLRGSTKNRKLTHIRHSLKLYIKLLFIPLAFFICWSLESIRRLIGNTTNPLFRNVSYMFNSSLGFFQVFIFFLSEIIGCCEDMRSRRSRKIYKSEPDDIKYVVMLCFVFFASFCIPLIHLNKFTVLKIQPMNTFVGLNLKTTHRVTLIK
jgi:hypothetical protein